jgi:cytochrome c2
VKRTSFLVLGLSALALGLAGCARPGDQISAALGDPHQGAEIVTRQACGSCHEIPGHQNADGLVGPPLGHLAERSTIAGVLPNTAPDLVLWLRSPQKVVPGNGMPDMGLTERQAEDVAAYLYTLE